MKTNSDQLVRLVTVFIWITAIVIVFFIIWGDVQGMLQGQAPLIQVSFTNTLNQNFEKEAFPMDAVKGHQMIELENYNGNGQLKNTSITTVTNMSKTKLHHPNRESSTAHARTSQEFRQKRMRDVCQNYYNISPLNLDDVNREQTLAVLKNRLQWTYFNDDFRFMVSYIYKVGSSTWRHVFQSLLTDSSDEFQRLQRDDALRTLSSKRFDKSPSEELSKRLLQFTKVIFVRHPLSRLLSAYQDKFVNLPTPWYRQKARLIIQRERGHLHPRRTAPNVTFSEFVHFITDERLGFLVQDDHWSTIYDRYRPCEYYFDFIGHLETVDEDIEYLFEMLKIDNIVSYKNARNPTHSSSLARLKEYYSQLSDDLFKKIIDKYEDDFRVFGYDIPSNTADFYRFF